MKQQHKFRAGKHSDIGQDSGQARKAGKDADKETGTKSVSPDKNVGPYPLILNAYPNPEQGNTIIEKDHLIH